jgi:hypothetical protein
MLIDKRARVGVIGIAQARAAQIAVHHQHVIEKLEITTCCEVRLAISRNYSGLYTVEVTDTTPPIFRKRKDYLERWISACRGYTPGEILRQFGWLID